MTPDDRLWNALLDCEALARAVSGRIQEVRNRRRTIAVFTGACSAGAIGSAIFLFGAEIGQWVTAGLSAATAVLAQFNSHVWGKDQIDELLGLSTAAKQLRGHLLHSWELRDSGTDPEAEDLAEWLQRLREIEDGAEQVGLKERFDAALVGVMQAHGRQPSEELLSRVQSSRKALPA